MLCVWSRALTIESDGDMCVDLYQSRMCVLMYKDEWRAWIMPRGLGTVAHINGKMRRADDVPQWHLGEGEVDL